MKDTGIVRKIDSLGRIVIPKGIRKSLNVREGDPLEIYVDNNELILKKYSHVMALCELAIDLAKSLKNITGKSVIITDVEKVVIGEGEAKELEGKSLSKEAIKVIKENKSFAINESENLKPLNITSSDINKFKSQLILPISTKKGDSIGIVALLDTDNTFKPTASDIRMLRLVCEILLIKSNV